MEQQDEFEAFEALVACPRCGRNGREADFVIIGLTADPPVGAFVGHYRCLTCRWDFIQPLPCDPKEAREFLQEVAAWRERHRPSLRLHRLYLRALYGASRGPRLDPLHRAHAELVRQQALARPWSGQEPSEQRGMEVTGPSGATLQIAFAFIESRWCLVCMGYRRGRPTMPTPEDEAYVTTLFLSSEERRAAARSIECDGETRNAVLYVVRLDPWLKPVPLWPAW